MTTTRACLFLLAILAGSPGHLAAQGKNDHGRAIAGTYDGTTAVELLQTTLPLRVELQRVHADSVVVKIPGMALPNGQVFRFTSMPLAVRPVTANGQRAYRLHVAFTYTYNNMPLRVEATATVSGRDLEGEVKAVIMDSMETRATYKGKKT
jgi:hypothetical protein